MQDIEVAGAVAPGARIGVYFGPKTHQDLSRIKTDVRPVDAARKLIKAELLRQRWQEQHVSTAEDDLDSSADQLCFNATKNATYRAGPAWLGVPSAASCPALAFAEYARALISERTRANIPRH